MKHFSLQRDFVFGALALGLVACAVAPAPGPKDATGNGIVAAGPIGPDPKESAKDAAPPPPPPPPHDVDKNVALDSAKKPILLPDSMQQGEGGVEDAKGERDDRDGAADPLMSLEMEGAARGPKPPPKAIAAAGGKGARGGQSGGLPGGSDPLAGAAMTGGTIGAASEVRGSLDKEEIRRVIRAHVNEVKRCYDQGLARRPDLEGKVTLKFTIGKTGTVVAATVQETTMNDRQVEQCIVGVALKWAFPKPAGEGVVTISYPFIFKSGS